MTDNPKSDTEQIDSIIDLALAEDLACGDVTGETLIPPELQGRALVAAKAGGVLAGGEVARRVFSKIDPTLKTELPIADGAIVKPGDVVCAVSGRVASILKGERVALNFLGRLSGIATYTARFVAETKGLRAKIFDTRKTTPGLRQLEKYAVRLGGGQNHRLHLGSAILIKDNHLTALRSLGMSLKDIVAGAKRKAPKGLIVEVEVSTLDEALAAVEGGADIIMLDNMSPDEIRRVKGLIPGDIKTEASGGITLTNVRAVARAGVDIISIGALTHSAPALDFSLELEPEAVKLSNTKLTK
ncbi:MAG TPA: carboxylating nicotinate-nucleotide diphosphorylase [Dehalococcoidia bacterium]|nr:carboxylating nicotinate-nucleotide diphosphorylase [Dehalococcoidia bacterium]